MKVRVTFEYDEDFAIALGKHFGEKRANRETVRRWCDMTLTATSDDIAAEDGAAPDSATDGK